MARARKPHPHPPHGHQQPPKKPAVCNVNPVAKFVRAMALLDAEYDDDDDTTLRTRIVQAKTYVDNNTHRAEVVATLPSRGDPGYFYATPSDPVGLYMGRGPSLTLLRFTGTPLP